MREELIPEVDVTDALTRLISLLFRQRGTPLSDIKSLLNAVQHLIPFRNPTTRTNSADPDLRRSLATALDAWLPWESDDLFRLDLPSGGAEREIWHNLLIGKPLEERAADGRTKSFLQGLGHKWSTSHPDLTWDVKKVRDRLRDHEAPMIARAILMVNQRVGVGGEQLRSGAVIKGGSMLLGNPYPPAPEPSWEFGRDATPISRRLAQRAFEMLETRGVVVLWGESGNGKSYLARELAQRWEMESGNAVHWVSAAEAGPKVSTYDHCLIRFLTSQGIDAASWSRSACELALRSALEQTSDLVVLDDIQPDDLERILPASPFRCVVTMRSKPSMDLRQVRVPAYTDEEAVAAAALLQPEVLSSDLRRLATALGNRPIAIDIGARLIRSNYLNFESLMAACLQDAPAAVDAALQLGGDATRGLAAVYQEVLDYIATMPDALELLMALVWLSARAPLRRHAQSLVFDGSLAPADQLRFDAALAILKKQGLVDERGTALELNELSVAYLRNLSGDRFQATASGFLADLQRVIADDESSEDGGSPPTDSRQWERYLDAAGVGWLLNLLKVVLPAGAQMGCHVIDKATWLIWQKDIEFFAPRGPTHEFALVRVTNDGVFLLGSGAQNSVPLSAVVSGRFYLCLELYGSAYHNAAGGVTDDREPSQSFIRLASADGLIHRSLSPLPSELEDRFFGHIFARCGLIFPLTAGWSQDGRDREQCSTCVLEDAGWAGWRDKAITSLYQLARLLPDVKSSACTLELAVIVANLSAEDGDARGARSYLVEASRLAPVTLPSQAATTLLGYLAISMDRRRVEVLDLFDAPLRAMGRDQVAELLSFLRAAWTCPEDEFGSLQDRLRVHEPIAVDRIELVILSYAWLVVGARLTSIGRRHDAIACLKVSGDLLDIAPSLPGVLPDREIALQRAVIDRFVERHGLGDE